MKEPFWPIVADCGGGGTVTLPMTILGLVLGCLMIYVEVPGTGILGTYTAAPTVNGCSEWLIIGSILSGRCFYADVISKSVNGKY